MPEPSIREGGNADDPRTPQPSIRGIGIRYLLALVLPVTGVILVLYTVAQLVGSLMH